MNNLTQILDEVTDDLAQLRKDKAPTYWLIMAGAGLLVTGLIIFLLKTFGIIVLVTVSFAFWANRLLNAWREIRKAEKEAAQAEAKRAVRINK